MDQGIYVLRTCSRFTVLGDTLEGFHRGWLVWINVFYNGWAKAWKFPFVKGEVC